MLLLLFSGEGAGGSATFPGPWVSINFANAPWNHSTSSSYWTVVQGVGISN